MRDNRGIILVASYLVIAVLLVLGSAFMSRSISENRFAQREKDAIKAFYLAEAGLEVAYEGFKQNWDGYTTGLPRSSVFSQSLGSGSFSVDIEEGPLPDTIKLTSKGIVGGIEKKLEEIIRGTVGSGLPGFDFAALAAGNLYLEGSGSIENQDVYVNGNLEVHSPDAVNGGNVYAKGNVTLLDGGSITGNVNANGNIVVESGTTITGDATSKEKVNNSGTITGTSTSYAIPDPVDEAALQAKVDSYRLSSEDWDNYKSQAQAEGHYYSGSFSPPSGTYTGTYYVEGALTIASDISGDATFAVGGSVNFTGGSVNLNPSSGSDYSFIIGDNVESTGATTGSLGGVIYTEGNFRVSTDITLAGAVICFGNLRGSGDFSIKFPEAGTALEILSWREL